MRHDLPPEAPPANEKLLIIRQQNAKQGFTGKPWRREQFYRLCRLIHCQPEELAERYFIPLDLLKRWINRDSIPPYVSFNFELLERAFFQASRKATT